MTNILNQQEQPDGQPGLLLQTGRVRPSLPGPAHSDPPLLRTAPAAPRQGRPPQGSNLQAPPLPLRFLVHPVSPGLSLHPPQALQPGLPPRHHRQSQLRSVHDQPGGQGVLRHHRTAPPQQSRKRGRLLRDEGLVPAQLAVQSPGGAGGKWPSPLGNLPRNGILQHIRKLPALRQLFRAGSRSDQDFLKEACAQGAPLIPKVQKILERHSLPSTSEGREQDMYMLGLTIFFVLTGINIRKLPPQPQKLQIVEEILNSLNFSREMKHMVRSLIESSTLRRMDNVQLRRLLKEKEATIIKNQSMEFLKTKANSQFKVERYLELQEKAEDKRRERNVKNYGSRTSLKSSHHEPVSLFASHRPSVQFSIDNQQSQRNYNPVRMVPKVTMTPQRPEQYYRPEPLLSRIHSADTIMRW